MKNAVVAPPFHRKQGIVGEAMADEQDVGFWHTPQGFTHYALALRLHRKTARRVTTDLRAWGSYWPLLEVEWCMDNNRKYLFNPPVSTR